MESSSSRRSVQFSTVQYRTGQNSTVQREERGRDGLILMGEDKALQGTTIRLGGYNSKN